MVLKRKRRGRGKVFLFFAGLALGGALFWNFFRVRQVFFFYTSQTDPAKLLEMTGLEPYQLMPLKLARLSEKIKAEKWVREVRYKFQFPDTLIFSLEERKPIFKLESYEDKVLTDDGMILTARKDQDLPYLALPFSFQRKGVLPQEIARGLKQLVRSNLGPHRMTRVELLPSSHLLVFLDYRVIVKWGRLDQNERKIVILKALLEKLDQKGERVAEINLQSPYNPAVRTE